MIIFDDVILKHHVCYRSQVGFARWQPNSGLKHEMETELDKEIERNHKREWFSIYKWAWIIANVKFSERLFWQSSAPLS